ncbi:conserved hypothetical protein [uncultured Pleomorphomonas sp.]|uniref:DUF4169 domain-containing protein n=2 Tax=Pleomorphomonas TaxID=261933 RepID=A0A2G9X2P4_9HYPH|nr:DUF4169 family protein [Pleomorphomonas carboxyditropha]PIP00631.1 hypothetical protein CJ014_00565 [Pleomorphomonas carboxyditropha]SCM72301.1 conserved hypothetical protein [uncultured Pleomorphomonas sp.]
MGDLVNLRRARKDRDRRRREDEAAENRVKFGRTKVEKLTARAQDELEARRLDGHRLASPADPEPSPDSST